MQYKAGTVSVEFANNIVTGIGTQWLSNIKAGDLFSIKDSRVIYEISSVNSDTQITLVGDYRGGNKTSNYIIHRDFTDISHLPLISRGDGNTGTVVTSMTRTIQEVFINYATYEYMGIWSAGSYVKGNVVLENKKLYIANIATSSQPPSSDWTIIYDGIDFIYSDSVEDLGVASSGLSTAPARADHIHQLPSNETLGTLSSSSTTEDIPESGDFRYFTFDREDELIDFLYTTHENTFP